MSLIVDAGDSVSQAQQQIMFLESMFTAAKAPELEFSDFGLCGLTKTLRDVLDLLETAGNALDQLADRERKERGIKI